MRGSQQASPGAQIAQICAVSKLSAPRCTTVHNGGYLRIGRGAVAVTERG